MPGPPPPRPRPPSPAWWFTDRRTGRTVVAQWPNPPLVVAVGAAVAGRLVAAGGSTARLLADVTDGALLAWGLDELVRGVNPWRRLLGAVVLAVTVHSLATR